MLNWLNTSGWEFREPLFLFAGLLAPIVYSMAARMPSSVTYSCLTLLESISPSLRVRLSWLPALLLSLATVAMAFALAGPRTGNAITKIKREGIGIIMVMDRSGSMDARDFVDGDYSISRLDALKKIIKEFVIGGESGKGRPNDMIGIVAFGTYADGLCPLTLDHANLLAILDDLEVATGRSEAATAIGEGLGLAVERLRNHAVQSKVIILLSDGVNNAGELDPLEAAELASTHNIKVYTIGSGITGYAPMPVQSPDGRTFLQRAWVEMDEKTLKDIAERTGGRYFHARNAEGLAATYREIDRLERSEITEVRYLQYEEHYGWFVMASLCLIAAAVLSGGTVFRRLP